jgi:hypothetical protein
VSKGDSWNDQDGAVAPALQPCLPITHANLSHLQVLLSGLEWLQVLLSGLEWLQMVPMPAEARPTLRRMAHALDELVEAVAAQRSNVRPLQGGISGGCRARRG